VEIEGKKNRKKKEFCRLSTKKFYVMIGGTIFRDYVSRSKDGTLKLQCGPHEFSGES